MDSYVCAIVIPFFVRRNVRDHSAFARIDALASVALGSDGERDAKRRWLNILGGIRHRLQMEVIPSGGVKGAYDLELRAEWEEVRSTIERIEQGNHERVDEWDDWGVEDGSMHVEAWWQVASRGVMSCVDNAYSLELHVSGTGN